MDCDLDLLRRYDQHGDQGAFATLFERHSSMVLATCRRILGSGHPQLEDACQAAFVILARKAGTFSHGRTLAGWLHRVARAASLDVLRAERRRHAHENASSSQPSYLPPKHIMDHDELRTHLDLALTRLSTAQREVVLLHVLEQKPQAIVAVELGISEGAVKKRVADAVAKLRDFFARRGFAVTSAGVVAALTLEAQAAATLPFASLASGVNAGGSQMSHAIADQFMKALAIKKWSAVGLTMAIGALTIGALAAGVMFVRPPASSHVAASTVSSALVRFAADPVYGTVGSVRGHWASSIEKVIVFLSPAKSTSVRAFDPVTNTWELLWPEGSLGIQGRQNFASFYVPRLDEIWVWGGSYLWNNPESLSSGRFNVSQKKWMDTGKDNSGAFRGIVDFSTLGAMPFSGTNPAMAWADQIDTGLMLGGSSESVSDYFLFEPKSGGPEPYKAEKITGFRPPWRTQCENCLVSDGRDFYLCGGFYQEADNPAWLNRKDLWKFDPALRTWSELPPPPDIAIAPAVTYDSDLHAIVTWVRDRLYVYDIASRTWSDRTPPGLPMVSNQIGVYAPTAKTHIFEGGNLGPDSRGFRENVGIKLAGGTPSGVTP